MTDDTMRRDFEAWISGGPLSTHRRSVDLSRDVWPPDFYINHETWIAWKAWQEAAARCGQREGGGDKGGGSRR